MAAKAGGGVPHDDTQLQVDALYHLAVELSGLRGVDNVLDVALRQCLTLTGSQFGFIGLVNQEATALEIAAIQGFHPTEEFFAGHRVIPLRPSIFAIAVLENRPARSLDARFDPRRIGQPSGHPEVRTFLGMPLRLNDQAHWNDRSRQSRWGPTRTGTSGSCSPTPPKSRNRHPECPAVRAARQHQRRTPRRSNAPASSTKPVNELARKAADLKKALEETVQAQENERQRIARDVHDGLNQLLIGALLELTSGQKRIELGQLEAARESLESSQSILRSVETEIRRVVHDLHPPMLEGLGLPAAIRRLCEQFESYGGMSCRTFVDGEPARMPGHAEITVYRIAQEALHNVLVHARAEKVRVDLLFEPDGLRLEVRDNGVGFDPELVRSAPNGHIGMVSMRQRAESLGGELQLESSPRLGNHRQGAGAFAADQMTPARGLIIDDHPVVRQGIKSLRSNYEAFEVVGEAATGQTAIDQFRSSRPDVVLLDIRLANDSGLEVLDSILDDDPEARVLMLSSFDDDEYVERSLRAGALGYVLKGDSDAQLVSAIEAVAGGHRALSPRVAEQLVELMLSPTQTHGPEFEEVDRAILRMLSDGASNGQIASKLFMSDSTVKRRIRSIFNRLGVTRRAEAAAEAARRGLV